MRWWKSGLTSLLVFFCSACQKGGVSMTSISKDYDEHYDTAYRGQYHYSTRDGWLNDPCGPFYYKGTYHLFYQHFHGVGVDTNRMCWGHATSTDLIHWNEKEDAIVFDALGSIWTGSVVVDQNNSSGLFPSGSGLLAFYTLEKGGIQQQSLAFSADEGETWTKYHDGEPIVTTAMDPLHNKDFRDPKVFYLLQCHKWVMLVAGGPLRIFSSTDLLHWSFESQVDGIVTECPDAFELQDQQGVSRWVLSLGGRYYVIGHFEVNTDKIQFILDQGEKKSFNFGPDSYASQHFQYALGGRIYVISWMSNWAYASKCAQLMDTFNGMMSLVYEYSLFEKNGEYYIKETPIQKYQDLLIGGNTLSGNISLVSHDEKAIDSYGSFHLNVGADIPENGVFALHFQVNDRNDFVISYDRSTAKLKVDRSKQEHYPTKQFLVSFETTFPLDEEGKLSLDLYVDRSSVEIVSGDQLTVGTFLYFPGEDVNVLFTSDSMPYKVSYIFEKISGIFYK
jgi:fructan beta-fructosidase